MKHYKGGEWQDPRSVPFLDIQCPVPCSFCSGEGPATDRRVTGLSVKYSKVSTLNFTFSSAFDSSAPYWLYKVTHLNSEYSETGCFEPETRIIVIKIMPIRDWPVLSVKSQLVTISGFGSHRVFTSIKI